jgi:hypothetical protein
MALSWWGIEIPSQCDQHHNTFLMAVQDMDWVLGELVKSLTGSEKHGLPEPDPEEQPERAAKRLFLHNLSTPLFSS